MRSQSDFYKKNQFVVSWHKVNQIFTKSPGEKLFDFLAECIADFVNNKLKYTGGNALPLGFTFSFPMKQHGLNVGILVSWTKSFNASGVVGQDAVKMLNESIKKRTDLKVNVVAILNDATGTLVKGQSVDTKII